MDVVVVGPRGLWLFEVKFWKGKIIWKDGQWTRWKEGHDSEQLVQVSVDQAPDEQWKRMRDELKKTFQIKGSDLLARCPVLNDVWGGIVFTHLGATYSIAKNQPFRWGNLKAWIEVLEHQSQPEMLSNYEVLQVLEILLSRHQEINTELAVRSADMMAKRIIRDVECNLEQWVDPVK